MPASSAAVSVAVVGALFRSGDRIVRAARLALVAVASLATFLAFLAAGIVDNAFTVQDVREARTPVLAQSHSDTIAEVVMRGPIWGDEQFPIVWVQPVAATGPPPPGLSAWPEPGHVVVSPGLLARREIIDEWGLSLSGVGSGADGTIGDDGVLTRSELLAYAAPPEGRDLGPGGARLGISGFGLPTGADGGILLETDPDYPSPLVAATGALLFIGVPSGALLAAAIRTRAPARSRRIEVLRLLGLTRHQLQTMLVLETLLLVAPGIVAGSVAGVVVLPYLTTVPLTGWELAPGALAPSPVSSLLAVLLTLALAGGMAVVPERWGDSASQSVGRSATGPPTPLQRALGFSVLAGSLVTLVVAGSSRGPWVASTLWATLLVLLLAWTPLTRTAIWALSATPLARQPTSPSRDLSRRQLSHGASALAALVGPLGLMTLLSGAVLSVVATTTGHADNPGAEPDNQIVMVSWRDPHVGDLDVFSHAVGPTIPVIPVVEGVASASHCELAASFVDLPEPVCESAGTLPPVVRETWQRLTGLDVQVAMGGEWAPIPPSADVLVRGVPIAGAYRIAFDHFTAPDVYDIHSGTKIVQPVAKWLQAGVVAASAIASLAALVRFADLAMASGSGTRRLERAGVPSAAARHVRLTVTRTALLVSTGTAAAYALVFSWAGVGAELTTLSLATVILCFLAVSVPGLLLLHASNRYGRG